MNLSKKQDDKDNYLADTGQTVSVTFDKKEMTIPADVFNLLWFADTKYKNYSPESKSFTVGDISISGGLNADMEPSALDSTLEIREGYPEKLSGHPSYSGMSPDQRFSYLRWLEDINEAPVDIGFAYTFYYGLEKWLFTEKFEEAIQMIARLKKTIDDDTLQEYTNNGLVYAAIKHSYPQALKHVNFTELKPELYLLLKYMFKQKISPGNLMQISRGVGFRNQRYINNETDLFEKALSHHLMKKFDEPYYKIDIPEGYDFDFIRLVPLANYSLNINTRNIEVDNLLSYAPLKEDIFNLLQESHEDVKVQLREIRKDAK